MSAPTLKPEEPMSLDRFTRTARGQELLDRAQEVRAIKREKDAVWPVLDAAEAIAAAATVVESGPNPVPALAERLRRSVDLLLDTTAAAGELSLEITKREILADFWKGRRATPEPPAQRAEGALCESGAMLAGAPRQCILPAGHDGLHRMPTGRGIAYVDEGAIVSEEILPASPDSVVGPLNTLGAEINEINRANGWKVVVPEEWPASDGVGNVYKVGTILALVHSEVSEALEAVRKYDRANFEEELADVLIRVLDCSAGLGIDMDATVRAKLAKNRQRAHRHGGKAV